VKLLLDQDGSAREMVAYNMSMHSLLLNTKPTLMKHPAAIAIWIGLATE
jgi:hypothetical protein